MQAKILMIEGKGAPSLSFAPSLRRKGFKVEVVSTGKAALALLPEFMPHLVVLDASSLRSSGKRICASVRDNQNGLPIVVIENPNHLFEEPELANVILAPPFTVRKLINRINPLLPIEGKNLVTAGPIVLDLDRNLVKCEGREMPLTPRLVSLLQLFLKQPGVVLAREYLFSKAWNTKYTADTRTLDVHISWLRHALEEDPRHPRFLKTMRGIGYRLDVDGS